MAILFPMLATAGMFESSASGEVKLTYTSASWAASSSLDGSTTRKSELYNPSSRKVLFCLGSSRAARAPTISKPLLTASWINVPPIRPVAPATQSLIIDKPFPELFFVQSLPQVYVEKDFYWFEDLRRIRINFPSSSQDNLKPFPRHLSQWLPHWSCGHPKDTHKSLA